MRARARARAGASSVRTRARARGGGAGDDYQRRTWALRLRGAKTRSVESGEIGVEKLGHVCPQAMFSLPHVVRGIVPRPAHMKLAYRKIVAMRLDLLHRVVVSAGCIGEHGRRLHGRRPQGRVARLVKPWGVHGDNGGPATEGSRRASRTLFSSTVMTSKGPIQRSVNL